MNDLDTQRDNVSLRALVASLGVQLRDANDATVSATTALRKSEDRVLQLLRSNDAIARLHTPIGDEGRMETSPARLEKLFEHGQEELRDVSEQRSRLAAIVDSSDDAIIGKDLRGIITSWNRGAERTFGYMANEILGESISFLVPSDRRREEEGILFDVARGGVLHLDTVRQTKDGRLIDVALTLSPVHDGFGRVVGISDVARDVSERKRNELAILEARDVALAANLELETFSYSVAHDLRTPLRGISGFAGLLLDAYADKLDAEGKVWLQQISGGAKKMAVLIDALLSLSRVTMTDLRRATVDVSAMVRSVASELAAGEPDVPTELVIQAGLSAEMDPRLALVLFENLLGNAFKFAGKKAVRRVEFGRTERRGGETFYVRDNGAGFDMAFADKLFVPFQRLHAAKEFPGTGVGLATVERIVRRHRGEIWAEGAVDHGATFYFTMPSRNDGDVLARTAKVLGRLVTPARSS